MKKLFWLLLLAFVLPEFVLAASITISTSDTACTASGSGATLTITCAGAAAPAPTPAPSPSPAPMPSACGNLSPVYADIQPYFDHTVSVSYTTSTMRRGEAYVLSFTTGAAAAGINMVSIQEYAGDPVYRYANISRQPCDFAVPAGYVQRGSTMLRYFSVGTPYGSYPMLEPNTKYYINIKNEDVVNSPGVDTCQPGFVCGFVLNFYRY